MTNNWKDTWGEALEKSGSPASEQPAAELDLRNSWRMLVQEGRYVEARRLLDQSKEAERGQSWWQGERASLLEKTGHLLPAADCYEKAGNIEMAGKLRAQAQSGIANTLSRRIPLELEMRWKALQGQAQPAGGSFPPDPAGMHELLRLCAETDAMQGEDPILRQSFWSSMDKMLRCMKPADLLPLRALQERKAGALAGEIRRLGDHDEAVLLFRRHPWARSAHELLLVSGEDALRDGRPNWAASAFQDVLTHADDPAQLAAARLGYWLALAGQPDWREDLELALNAVRDEVTLPWRGTLTKAAAIKAAVRIPAPDAGGTALLPLSSVRRIKIQLPAALAADEPVAPDQKFVSAGLGPWTIRRLDLAGDRLVVVSSRHLACYDVHTMKLRQMCDSTLPAGNLIKEESRAAKLRLRFGVPADIPSQPEQLAVDNATSVWVEPAWRSAIVGRSWNSVIGKSDGLLPESLAIFSLARVNSGTGPEQVVAAWDADKGVLLWNTAGREEWKDLSPQSEPVAGEGRLYVLAVNRKIAKNRPLYLICLNGGSGAIMWKRMLGMMPADDRLRGLASGGSGIALYEGALYISTDAGMVARCDARDGVVEWVRTYSSALMGELSALQYRREGMAPVLAGGKILVAPRDHTGVMALDPVSGQLLWESLLVPSERIVGVAGQMLVTQGRDCLVALDLTSGAEAWVKDFDEAMDSRATVVGADVLVVAGDSLFRCRAATGLTADEVRLNGAPGAGFALLADGSLVELVEEPLPAPVSRPGSTVGPLQLPFVEQWTLPCERPLLVKGPVGGVASNMIGVLAGRLLLCVEAQPGGRIVWQTRLRSRPDSVGFHGGLVLAVRNRILTAFNAASGATEWVQRLPFRIDLAGGDERAIFACELTETGRVAAIEPGSGKVLWLRWFGREDRLAGGRLQWAGIQEASGLPCLRLYCTSALFSKEGRRPAEVIVDAASGAVLDVRCFLSAEPLWPAQIAFGDIRSYTRKLRLPPWPGMGPFLPDAVAYVGQGGLAHFARLQQGQNLAAGWNPVMDIRPEAQYWSSAGLHPTDAGPFVRRIGQLAFFDMTRSTGIVYDLPRNVERTAYNILDFRADTGRVVVVSGSESTVNDAVRRRYQPFVWDGLRDCTGMGDVRVQCFKDQAQIGTSSLKLPEAGSNPTATLLNGQIKQHYQGSCIRMSNISSLGWSKYDVYFYGFTGTASIDGVATQKCAGADYSKAINRTTFVPGVNYIKFAGVSGDAFTLEFTESSFSAIQIANASPGATKEKPQALGIGWSSLRPTDVLGAEVVCDNWNSGTLNSMVSPARQDIPPRTKSGMSVDIFERSTGRLVGTQSLPGEQSAGYANQARLFDSGLLTADADGVHFFRPAAIIGVSH